ncbi:MAG: hypothetical protein ABIP75_10940 [Pyrinomonadaceae bacterium]
MTAVFLLACLKPADLNTSQTSPTPALVSANFNELTADAVVQAFKKSNLPIYGEVAYNTDTDANHLLGRPNQYVGKISFEDKRVNGPKMPLNNTIEVFAAKVDLENRKSYIEEIVKKASPLGQYFFVHKNVLLRLEFSLTPNQAKEYETVLNSL